MQETLYDVSMERSVLNTLFFDFERVVDEHLDIFGSLRREFFYLPFHSSMFQTISDLYEIDKPVDELMVRDHLVNKGIFDETAMLMVLTSNVLSPTSLESYIDTMRKRYVARETIVTLAQSKSALEESGDAIGVLSDLEQHIETIHAFNAGDGRFKTARQLLDNRNRLKDRRITTDFPPIDSVLGGLDEGSLTILTGEFESGKTHLAYSMIERASLAYKVGLLSLEFGEEDYEERLLQLSHLNMDQDNIITNFDTFYISEVMGALYSLYHKGVKVVVIDSLGKIFDTGNKSETERVTDIVRKIDMVARKTKMAILLIAQGSKEENRDGRAGIMYSVMAGHIAKNFLLIVKEKDGSRTLKAIKNKQVRRYFDQKLLFEEDGRILKIGKEFSFMASSKEKKDVFGDFN